MPVGGCVGGLAWSCGHRRGGATEEVSGGEAGWRDGRRRRTRATFHGHKDVPTWMRPLPLLPRSPVVCGLRGSCFVRGGTYVAVSSVGCALWPKADHFGRSWGCLDAGRQPRRREARSSWAGLAPRVRASGHGHTGGWSRVVDGARLHRRGGCAGVHYLPNLVLADGGGVRGHRILPVGSVVVAFLLRVAPGENPIFGIGWWRLSWSFPSWRHHLGVLVSLFSVSPLLGGLEVSVGSKRISLPHL